MSERIDADDDPGVVMWEFTCPDCGAIEMQTPPQPGDEVACPMCDFEATVKRIEVDDGV